MNQAQYNLLIVAILDVALATEISNGVSPANAVRRQQSRMKSLFNAFKRDDYKEVFDNALSAVGGGSAPGGTDEGVDDVPAI